MCNEMFDFLFMRFLRTFENHFENMFSNNILTITIEYVNSEYF